ncbi:DNA glycosylase AlkZ-like family protein [Nitrincola alkalisediminis]|uniref:DNA glycosylase AlkZ-like family protein n=1 Tax=Nitrincola alkalisediminis TaxID=1366656 RepID=UPI001FE2BC21|nr:crosslink repair DNA glycosylase YcaQ family protein [Nitrincola alkalisediminis]
MTYQRRNAELRRAVKTLVNDKLAQGSLEQIKLTRGEVFIVKAGALEHPLPRLNNRMVILSPFDNSVIQRERLKVLFDYDYQIECYVPAARRQYGYFCLPLLYRDAFVGRMDCKAHRKDRRLKIKSLYFEQQGLDEDQIVKAFIDAIKGFCLFQECDSVFLQAVYPIRLGQGLCSALTLSIGDTP